MVIRNSDQDWESFARIDPYYAVATVETFHRENLNEDTLREFFERGRGHVEEIFKIIHTHFAPGFRPSRALDFGGVGRLVLPLADLCTFVVGVDVSESMLLEAKRNCEERRISNVEFIKGDDELARVSGSFDFINSHVVFQHIPTKRGEKLVEKLIDRLEDRGIAVLHFAYATESSSFRKGVSSLRKLVPGVHGVLNVLQGRTFDYPLMQGNRYNLNKILRVLQANGCNDLHVRFTDYPGNHGVILFFRKFISQ